MKFHIVGNNESVQDILNSYDLTIDELKSENKHIRVWKYLIPGTKLKIPVLTESMNEEINEMEPFIEDYYPKIKIEEENYEILNEEDNEININDFIENNEENNILENQEEQNNEEILIDKELLEDSNQRENIDITETKEKTSEKIIYRYVYPNPYYRPIIYVIPRRKPFI